MAVPPTLFDGNARRGKQTETKRRTNEPDYINTHDRPERARTRGREPEEKNAIVLRMRV